MKPLKPLKSLLTRETSGQKLIPQIDGLRFVAIASVVAYHINGYVVQTSPHHNSEAAGTDWICKILAEGHTGVQLFFVISGFILGIPFAKQFVKDGKRVDLVPYLLRRIIRLEPTYIIAMTTALLATVFLKGGDLANLFAHYLASIFYVHYFVYGEGSTLIAAAWSLEIEIQFYIFAPLLARIFMVKSKATRRALLVGSIFVCGLIQYGVEYPPHSPMHGWTILSSLHWFLTGFLLCDLFVEGELSSGKRHALWDLSGAIAWIAIWCVVYFRFHIHIVLPFLILIAYAASFKGRIFKAILSYSWIYIIGGMCYTIYLYHGFIISFVGRFTIRKQFGSTLGSEAIFQCLIISSIILAICSVLFLLAEKPFMSRSLFLKVLQKLGLKKAPQPEPNNKA